MSYKPDEKDWMAYLYGELEDTEKERMDQYLLDHAEAREEFKKFQTLRTMLSAMEDKEVIAPPLFIDNHPGNNHTGNQRQLWNTPHFKTFVSIAASLLIVMLVGKLTGTQITASDKEFKLTFGSAQEVQPVQQQPVTVALSPEQVQQMINASLNNHNMAMDASLKQTQTELDASIRRNLALNSGKVNQLVREAASASQEQIREFVDGIRTENMEQVKDYFKLTSTEQKKYIENLLVDFARYLQQQRNNDLQLVQTRMNSLEQNTDMFKQETEQILSSIITTVGDPSGTETKN